MIVIAGGHQLPRQQRGRGAGGSSGEAGQLPNSRQHHPSSSAVAASAASGPQRDHLLPHRGLLQVKELGGEAYLVKADMSKVGWLSSLLLVHCRQLLQPGLIPMLGPCCGHHLLISLCLSKQPVYG